MQLNKDWLNQFLTILLVMTNSWYYREMGSRNKKTGKLSYYRVRVTDYKIDDCECPARQFRSYSPCKHMKRLNEKLTHLTI
jgi:hypothetical protein